METSDAEGEFCKKTTYPDTPISIDDLPDNVKAILKDHLLEMDISENERIQVPHAY